MKHILQDNALESWAMAIKYSNFILNGKAILQYRKQFVSSLHNAVELFIKQLMLDNNDHRVCSVRKGCDAGGHPAVEFYNAADLNSYFEKLADEDMKKFYSIEFNEIQRLVKELFSGYYGEHSADKVVVDDSIALLGRLRNGETHFFVEKNSFLTDKEFQKLYNFMIVFNTILHYYNLLPYWGKPWGECVCVNNRSVLESTLSLNWALAEHSHKGNKKIENYDDFKSFFRSIESIIKPSDYDDAYVEDYGEVFIEVFGKKYSVIVGTGHNMVFACLQFLPILACELNKKDELIKVMTYNSFIIDFLKESNIKDGKYGARLVLPSEALFIKVKERLIGWTRF